MNESMVIYISWVDSLEGLSDKDYRECMTALIDYGMRGKPIRTDGIAGMFVSMAKHQIDANNQKRENGKKGGSVRGQVRTDTEKKEANVSKPKQTEANVSKPKQTEANVNVNVNGYVNDNVNVNDNANVNENVNGNSGIEKKEKDKLLRVKQRNILSGKPDHTPVYPYREIIEYLNSKAGTNFRVNSKDTRKHIKARFDEGFTLDDFKRVIDIKVADWLNDPKMVKYLQPSTLFGVKFENYLNQKIVQPTQWRTEAERIANRMAVIDSWVQQGNNSGF